MSGLTISEIRAALADQIRNNIKRDTNVYAYAHGDYQYPAITVDYGSQFIQFFRTYSADGLSLLRFAVRVETSGLDKESAAIALDDYLSAGTGNGSSLADAIMSDRYLGFGETAGVSVQVTDLEVDPVTTTAEFTVEVHIAKNNAEV